jgi:putative ABC transport system ATP-binding protein
MTRSDLSPELKEKLQARTFVEGWLEGDVVEWAVELNDVRKTYRTGPIEVPALRGVSLRIAAGEFVAAAGPSGSGKTTLLNIIGGLDRADTGKVFVAGQNLQLLSSGGLAGLRLHRIGFVFQTYNLMPVLTALENAEFTLLLQGMSAAARKKKVQKLFSEIGLAGLEDRRPAELSGGQQQRVAVARAMVTEPALILADEPTANLDSATAIALLDVMQHLNRTTGTTFVFSTHDPQVMERARRMIRLRDGEIASDDMREEPEDHVAARRSSV